jgi:hypothetical protein
MSEWLENAAEAIREWCRGKSPLVRAPLVLWLAYIGVRHLGNTDYTSIFGGLDLGIHEAGHIVFSWLPGQFPMVAGGTILQLAAPVAAAVLLARQPDYFGAGFCGGWLAMNLYNVATYMADARELDLPLVNVGGGEAGHDWNMMLGTLGLLSWDARLAGLVRLLAFAAMWGSIALCSWMLWLMLTGSGKAPIVARRGGGN